MEHSTGQTLSAIPSEVILVPPPIIMVDRRLLRI
jgi:hypothetical protein